MDGKTAPEIFGEWNTERWHRAVFVNADSDPRRGGGMGRQAAGRGARRDGEHGGGGYLHAAALVGLVGTRIRFGGHIFTVLDDSAVRGDRRRASGGRKE